MNILHVNDTFDGLGGVDRYILSLAALLEAGGHENVILYRQRSAHSVTDGQWPVHWVRETGGVRAQIQDVVTLHRPDVAFVHHVASAVMVETVSALLPTAAYIHGFQAVCPGLAKYFRRGDTVCRLPFSWACFPMHYLRRCSAARDPRTIRALMKKTAGLQQAFRQIRRVFVASEYMKQLLVQNGFARERISLLAPHFFPDSFNPPFVPPEDEHTILFAARLEIEKGLPYLLRALRQLPRPIRLMIAGDGTQRARYEQLSAELKLENRVVFLGWQSEEELANLYRRCALLVMPGVFPEPFGKVGVEALSHGRPVVAFDVGGVSIWLRNKENGLLVKPADAHRLAEAIARLLADDKRRLEMGRRGQQNVLRQFTAADHMATLLPAFRDLQGVNG